MTGSVWPPQAHYFIGAELERNTVKAFSVAPRFPGDFQKGIDYSGDVGRLHIKTSGTSWLEALRIISLKGLALFRPIYESAKELFPKALKYYKVTPDMNALPLISNLGDKELSDVFMSPDARQVLHVTY